MNSNIETIDCTRIRNGSRITEKEVVATESKLALYVNDEFETQFLYSSGFDEHLVYGYLLSSGKISNISDIDTIQITNQDCRVNLTKEHRLDSDYVNHQKVVSFVKLLEIRDLLLESQQNHRATRGFHGAILYELATNRRFTCEDIGRHNAVDKVIGCGLQEGYDLSNSVLLLSGRLLSNIVSKGIHSKIPVIASMTVATSGGIREAKKNNRTLVGSLSNDGCWLYHEGVVKVQTSIQ